MESAKLLYAIIETAIDGILTIDDRGNVESLNPAAQRIFGYTAEEVIGKNVSMLMPEPDKSGHNGYLKNYQHTGIKKIVGQGREVRGLRKDGTTFPFRLAVSEVQYDDRMIYTGFVHDLSREKQSEEQLKEYASELEDLVEERTRSLQKMVASLNAAKEEVSISLKKEIELNQLKSRFVSMASHEFRTPLSSIQLSSVLIDKYATPSENINIKKHVGRIKSAVGNLTTILNDFLSLERLEAGKVTPSFQPFDIMLLAQEITEELQMVAKSDQNIIYRHKGLSNMVKLDKSLLRNCMINLISNAIKYSGASTVIKFDTEITAQHTLVCISDNGIGIPKSDQEHLFEPFFRAHNTGDVPGTGLGLNIVLRYAGLMDGKLHFKSEINEGAKFTLSFPNT